MLRLNDLLLGSLSVRSRIHRQHFLYHNCHPRQYLKKQNLAGEDTSLFQQPLGKTPETAKNSIIAAKAETILIHV